MLNCHYHKHRPRADTIHEKLAASIVKEGVKTHVQKSHGRMVASKNSTKLMPHTLRAQFRPPSCTSQVCGCDCVVCVCGAYVCVWLWM